MIQQLDHDSVSLHIAAQPNTIYELVADVTRTPEFSPEIIECRWLDGATGPAVGRDSKPGTRCRTDPRSPTSRSSPSWSRARRSHSHARNHSVAPSNGATTSHPTAMAPSSRSPTPSPNLSRALGWFIIGTLFGRKNRQTDLHDGMTKTLDRLRQVAEHQPNADTLKQRETETTSSALQQKLRSGRPTTIRGNRWHAALRPEPLFKHTQVTVTLIREAAHGRRPHDGWVTLGGEVRHHYQRQAAEHAVRKVDGVLGIDNGIARRYRSRATSPITSRTRSQARGDHQRLAHRGVERRPHGLPRRQGRLVGGTPSRGRHAWNAPGVNMVIDRLEVA